VTYLPHSLPRSLCLAAYSRHKCGKAGIETVKDGVGEIKGRRVFVRLDKIVHNFLELLPQCEQPRVLLG
jgi:hypothetical protein